MVYLPRYRGAGACRMAMSKVAMSKVAMSCPFRLAAVVNRFDESRKPGWQAKESHRIMLQNVRAVHELGN